MREVKFDFIYKTGSGLKHKKYVLETVMLGIEKVCDLHDCELIAKRQFTGLLDKNGIEIYEGDIVKIELEKNNFTTAYINFNVKLGKYLVHYIDDDFDEEFSDWTTIEHFEVIGNTYENPEFLEAVK